ncbi:hypothetical protein B7P43_G07842 [Cryptotermes secundus]|uniref:Protein kinase domain-containing protein n=1 Tax=Cryptotermes secundus TaxID=105785 RepID=A0A2J7QEZ2_9NEOP|nr:hypothetical protein B7P43_G07842 [Cryptotermes secundus]
MYTPNVAKPMAPKVNPVSRQNFDVLSVLGAGGFGKVFLVRKTDGADSGRLYAMKVLEKADIMKTKKFIEYTKTERQVLEEVKCSPFLIELHYAFQTSEKLHLILALDWMCCCKWGDNHLLPWPPRSPDLTPCDFFLWGFVKDNIYVPPLPTSIHELHDWITHALQAITADMLHCVDVCCVTQGAHIEDYVCGGDLFAHFCEQQEFPEKDVCFYVGEVVLALEQLHKIGVIYRDLKPENLLIDKEGHLILTDFGLSKKFMPNETPRTYSYCGTLEYMAPEVVQEAPSGHGMVVLYNSPSVEVQLRTYFTLALDEGSRLVEHWNSDMRTANRKSSLQC